MCLLLQSGIVTPKLTTISHLVHTIYQQELPFTLSSQN